VCMLSESLSICWLQVGQRRNLAVQAGEGPHTPYGRLGGLLRVGFLVGAGSLLEVREWSQACQIQSGGWLA
jgi:hypothetical protein